MKLIVPILAMSLAVPAAAQVVAPPPAAPAPAADAGDQADDSQNRMVCKSQKATGSRLRAEKLCMTKAQWAQKQQDERQATERSQTQRQTF